MRPSHTRLAKIEWSVIAKTIKYAFQCVLKGKFSSFYQDQYFPLLKPSDEPKEEEEEDQKIPIFIPLHLQLCFISNAYKQ